MKDTVFTSYAFGGLYVYQQERLRQSILKVYPDANIRFWHSDPESSLNRRDELPPGSPTFAESMYGFKVHCVKNCLKDGFKKVIFLDAAMILEGPIDDVMEFASRVGVLCAAERIPVEDVISDRCKEFVNTDLSDMVLVGGSVYIFDFNNPITQKVFDEWARLEQFGMFGSEDDCSNGRLQSHRKDETCMSIALFTNGCKPYGFDKVGYHNMGSGQPQTRKFTFHKLHFKGIGKIHDHSFNQVFIPPHGNVLDLGCRDFVFTNFFKKEEYNVYSVDIGEFEGDYYRIGISHEDGVCAVQHERDPDAMSIKPGNEIPMMTIESFGRMVGVDHWDLIKMDIEGAEYQILKQGKHPMAKQISVEFHAHCEQTGQNRINLDELLRELSEFYYIENKEWKKASGCGENYWDILLIAK